MVQPGSVLLATVERSPAAAAAHDRAGWVGLFTDDGRIEDPVGSRPHVGPAQIARFYETFIGPRDITFHPEVDIARDSTVVRDLELEVAMGPAVTMNIPAFLRYDLREINGEWKIAGLRAYWDLPAMMLQFLRNGAPAGWAMLQLSQGLLGNQGLGGTAGFAAGFRRAGHRHKKTLDRFLSAAARGDSPAATQMLSPSAAITLDDSGEICASGLVERLREASWAKTIGAGPTVAVSVTSLRGRGVLFAEFTRRGTQITRVRYFPA